MCKNVKDFFVYVVLLALLCHKRLYAILDLAFKFVTYCFPAEICPYFDIFFQKIGTPTSVVEMVAEDLKALKWEVFVEKAGIWERPDFVKKGFVDHINTTKDTTDYLWYTTRFVLY